MKLLTGVTVIIDSVTFITKIGKYELGVKFLQRTGLHDIIIIRPRRSL